MRTQILNTLDHTDQRADKIEWTPYVTFMFVFQTFYLKHLMISNSIAQEKSMVKGSKK